MSQPVVVPLPPDHPCANCRARPASFCRKLHADTLTDLRAMGKLISLNAGQPLFFEGDAVKRVFMVAEGALKLYALLGDGRRQVTGFMFPGDFLGIYHLAAHELAAAQQQMVLLGRKNAAERLASFLLMLACRHERLSGHPQDIVPLPMSRLDIADYLGLTKETVSRMIAFLRDKRLIRLASQNRVEIVDRDGLADLAAGFGEE